MSREPPTLVEITSSTKQVKWGWSRKVLVFYGIRGCQFPLNASVEGPSPLKMETQGVAGENILNYFCLFW